MAPPLLNTPSDPSMAQAWTMDESFWEPQLYPICSTTPLLPILPFLETPLVDYSSHYTPVAVADLPEMIYPQPFPTLWRRNYTETDRVEFDRRHFWNMLVTTIPQVPKDKYRLRSQVRILDVACGEATNAAALHAYFGKADYGQKGSNVTYIGIDIDPIQIEAAHSIHLDRPDLKFVIADATKLSDRPELQGLFDIVVIRHPEFFNNGIPNEVWLDIVKEAFSKLNRGGLLIITNYQCGEHATANRMMSYLEGTTLLSARNPFTGHVSADRDRNPQLRYRDRYVNVYTKK